MATKKTGDTFANYAALSITESAANTFTSSKFQFPFSIMDKMALVLQRVEYDFLATGTSVWGAAGDCMTAGLCVNATISDVDNPADPMMVDTVRIRRLDMGTAATGQLLQLPLVKDFTNLMGGGLLVAPNPFYGFVKGISAAAAGSITIKLFYTYLELSTDDYWQLVESRRIISS